MNSIQKRFLLFLFGCIGTRLTLTFIAKNISILYLPYISIVTLFITIGITYYYMSGTRKTGPEVFGDKIWWAELRPIHILFYALFTYNAFNKVPESWYYLLADTIIGLIMFLTFHFYEGNFSKLF